LVPWFMSHTRFAGDKQTSWTTPHRDNAEKNQDSSHSVEFMGTVKALSKTIYISCTSTSDRYRIYSVLQHNGIDLQHNDKGFESTVDTHTFFHRAGPGRQASIQFEAKNRIARITGRCVMLQYVSMSNDNFSHHPCDVMCCHHTFCICCTENCQCLETSTVSMLRNSNKPGRENHRRFSWW
jgi:hypothetical protein